MAVNGIITDYLYSRDITGMRRGYADRVHVICSINNLGIIASIDLLFGGQASRALDLVLRFAYTLKGI